MKWPFVILPRSVYEDQRAEHRDLVEKYHALKLQGAAGRVAAPGKAHLPGPQPEELALVEAERVAIESMEADFRRQGLSPELARQEAQRIATSFKSSAPAPLY